MTTTTTVTSAVFHPQEQAETPELTMTTRHEMIITPPPTKPTLIHTSDANADIIEYRTHHKDININHDASNNAPTVDRITHVSATTRDNNNDKDAASIDNNNSISRNSNHDASPDNINNDGNNGSITTNNSNDANTNDVSKDDQSNNDGNNDFPFHYIITSRLYNNNYDDTFSDNENYNENFYENNNIENEHYNEPNHDSHPHHPT